MKQKTADIAVRRSKLFGQYASSWFRSETFYHRLITPPRFLCRESEVIARIVHGVAYSATNDLRLSRPRPSFAAMNKADILDELPKLGCDERREIFERLCTLQEAEFSGVHQQWVDEALSSGPARSASPSDWAGALQRGLFQAAKRG